MFGLRLRSNYWQQWSFMYAESNSVSEVRSSPYDFQNGKKLKSSSWFLSEPALSMIWRLTRLFIVSRSTRDDKVVLAIRAMHFWQPCQYPQDYTQSLPNYIRKNIVLCCESISPSIDTWLAVRKSVINKKYKRIFSYWKCVLIIDLELDAVKHFWYFTAR